MMCSRRQTVWLFVSLTIYSLLNAVRCVNTSRAAGDDHASTSASPTSSTYSSSARSGGASSSSYGSSDVSTKSKAAIKRPAPSASDVPTAAATTLEPETKRKRGRPPGSRNFPSEWKNVYVTTGGKKAALNKFIRDYTQDGDEQLNALRNTDDRATIEAKNEKVRRTGSKVLETIHMPAIDRLDESQLTPAQRALKQRLADMQGDPAKQKSFLRVLGNARSAERRKAAKSNTAKSSDGSVKQG